MHATARPLRTLGSAGHASDFIRQLMVEHGRSVLASVTRMVHDRGLAEDVVQEALVRAWRNMERFDPSRDVAMRGWLLTVARNIAVDKFRAKNARPAEVAESAALSVCVPDPSEAVLSAMHIQTALARLSEAQRAVLLECYFNGRTVTEAAQTLGIPLGTVKSRLSSALRNLRDELAEPAVAA